MKNRAILLLLTLVFILGCAAKPPKDNLHESMIRLDKKYIPALFFTGLYKARESELALTFLRSTWNDFHLRFYNLKLKYGVDIVDTFWQSDFDKINALITSAEGFVKTRDFKQAHYSLLQVREIFADLRARAGINYFLDGLTAFDQKLVELQAMLRGKSRFTEQEKRRLNEAYTEIAACWQGLASFKIDSKLYGFPKKKITAIKKLLKAEQQALDNFKQTLALAQPGESLAAAQALQPTFVVLYKAFGDFQPIFDAIIRERDAEAPKRPEKALKAEEGKKKKKK